MKEYIERILHQDVDIVPYEDIQKLPLAYRSAYDINLMTISGQEALLISPVEKIPLVTMRKQQHQMEIYTGLPCVLYLKDMNYYSRDAMVKEGIPFVWEGHQIYLPFIGTLLNDSPQRTVMTCVQISFLTQKLLLTALYQGWKRVTVTKAAEILGVSKMSVTRCFDELEAKDIPYLMIRNRARSITADNNKRTMWEAIHPVLRNPVITSYALKEKPDRELPLAGMTALAHYSMLDEEEYPILAVTKRELSYLDLSERNITPAGELPGCMIQEIGYWIPFEAGRALDPLSVVLSLNEEALADPRISMAADEMLEEYVW